MATLLLAHATYIWVLSFMHMRFVDIQHSMTPSERFQQHLFFFYDESHRSHIVHEDCTWHGLHILVTASFCCNPIAWAASTQRFILWQPAAIKITCDLILWWLVHATYICVLFSIEISSLDSIAQHGQWSVLLCHTYKPQKEPYPTHVSRCRNVQHQCRGSKSGPTLYWVAILGVWVMMSGIRVRGLVLFSNYSAFHPWYTQSTTLLLLSLGELFFTVWASCYCGLLGHTGSQSRFWAEIWLSHHPEPSRHVVHMEAMDWTLETTRWMACSSVPHSQPQRRPCPICASSDVNVPHQRRGGWAGPTLFLEVSFQQGGYQCQGWNYRVL